MSRNNLLRGTTVRKSAQSAATTRSNTPHAAQAAPTTFFNGGVKDSSGRTAEFWSEDDQCPVCKSDRYLNKKLRLLVSSCYHKMCESCIDRLFTLGPAPCPICNKTLRKLAFIPQTFEDLAVEKEVAVRRRMAKEFNKRREDFPDLRSYNNYLEDVEDITFNLINDIDIPETEARIATYRAENAALTELNAQREEAYAQALKEQEETERRERQARAEELRRAEEEERAAREAERQTLIDSLQASDIDAARLVHRSRKEALKRAAARTAAAQENVRLQSSAQLLRARAAAAAAVPDEPHVPMQDSYYAYEDMFSVKDRYFDRRTDSVRRDLEPHYRAGGYRIEEAWGRALRAAVAELELPPLSGTETGAGMDVVIAGA
ncbi:CDK-activating kinase assembly factor MAT1-domain-containing protein [Vararia minispora EC-137]|uniref:CDK-activating kinase assembly factor MAT1-domain-containing protein n=1 Tax=Vararia minispora EC-137 TaxID=1314806 RepID=A0ACB8QD50_9AGAM|nr:CDK-activating kinase assembly factor MAT1-domain-containing protein [Vararia minispora EC-137]